MLNSPSTEKLHDRILTFSRQENNTDSISKQERRSEHLTQLVRGMIKPDIVNTDKTCTFNGLEKLMIVRRLMISPLPLNSPHKSHRRCLADKAGQMGMVLEQIQQN